MVDCGTTKKRLYNPQLILSSIQIIFNVLLLFPAVNYQIITQSKLQSTRMVISTTR
jgi:hypothetical protein